ncbi:MAG: hypothetical protein CL398_07905 [Acidiferrobacteraceae bacterium]|nr:hypothetical protein [Acidiferrobacteraceae bacterium]|tara:strand:- start:969 stop:1406 length:438 start_codon:yes stop_codon:yes gene_type:complete
MFDKLLYELFVVAQNPKLIAPWILFFVALSVLYAGGVLLAVVHMSQDYFINPNPAKTSWRGEHPLLRILLRCLKNVIGFGLLVLGVAMLVLPGQGVLTILIGLTMVEFPGKRNLEIRIIQHHRIRRAINAVRRRAGKPPLMLPDP